HTGLDSRHRVPGVEVLLHSFSACPGRLLVPPERDAHRAHALGVMEEVGAQKARRLARDRKVVVLEPLAADVPVLLCDGLIANRPRPHAETLRPTGFLV